LSLTHATTTIHETILEAQRRLHAAGVPTSWLDAEILLAHALDQPREYLTAHADDGISVQTRKQFQRSITHRVRGRPVAYMTGKKEFYGLSLKVTKDVLIPRPATEELIEMVLRNIPAPTSRHHLFIDIGTGSGCIAVTLAKHVPHAQIIASDISKNALAVAEINAREHKVADRISFLRGDLLDPVACYLNKIKLWPVPHEVSCTIIANLPYVPTTIVRSRKELYAEPSMALDGGQDGTFYYRRLLSQINQYRNKWRPARIFLEADITSMQALLSSAELARMKKTFTMHDTRHVMSLTKKPRV